MPEDKLEYDITQAKIHVKQSKAEVVMPLVVKSSQGRPRSSFNDDALHDCQTCRIGRPYRDAQDRLLMTSLTLS